MNLISTRHGTHFIECECGELFLCDPSSGENLYWCSEDQCLKAECPKCGSRSE